MAAYGLPKSGNRNALIDRLRGFANMGVKGWESKLLQPDRPRERGDISERAAKNDPTSQRILKLFGPKAQLTVYLPKRNGHEVRPLGVLSHQRRTSNDEWAKLVLDKNNQRNPQASGFHWQGSELCGRHLEGVDEEGVHNKTPSERRVERRLISYQQEIKNQCGGVHNELTCLRSDVASLLTVTAKALTATSAAQNTTTRTQRDVPADDSHDGPSGADVRTAGSGTVVTACRKHCKSRTHLHHPALAVTASRHTVIAREAIPPEHRRFFNLEDGVLYFHEAQVPDPPKVTFADDLSQLFKDWYVSDLLIVNGRGIPVRDWDSFYRKRTGIKQHAWDALRVQWGLWKHIVTEREHFPSEELFWAKYSDEDGKHLNFKTICELLQGGRRETDEHDSAAALWFFENDLTHPAAHGYFRYKKSGKWKLCTGVRGIAKKWRLLLQEQPEVAQRWAEVRDHFSPTEHLPRT
ncbi:hypothetical protein V8D89_009370 [Ganoderma adspersum]